MEIPLYALANIGFSNYGIFYENIKSFMITSLIFSSKFLVKSVIKVEYRIYGIFKIFILLNNL